MMLQSVLTYHVVPGQFTAADLKWRIGAIGEDGARRPAGGGGTQTARINHLTDRVSLPA